LDQVGGRTVIAEHEHVGIDRRDVVVEERDGGEMTERGGHGGVREELLRLLGCAPSATASG
jgi:hypothetical protein